VTLEAPLRPSEATQIKQRALSGFLRRIGVTDLLVITWAVLGAEVLRFGSDAVEATLPGRAETSLDERYTAFSIALIIAWAFMLRVHGAYDKRLLGHGPEEYKAVATASFRLFGVLTVISYVLQLDIARGYVAMAMPAGLIGLLLGRWLWRKWLRLHRVQAAPGPGPAVVVGAGGR
jgi:FlaA1/EpsC-like NDP-sugar epimerase